MQRNKTIKFWGDMYSSLYQNDEHVVADTNTNPAAEAVQLYKYEKEWILKPTDALFKIIFKYAMHRKEYQNVSVTTHVEMLEIGCGASYLSREFFKYLTKQDSPKLQYYLTASDVSSVCINNMISRDHDDILSSSGKFSYKELNILEAIDPEKKSRYCIVFDKGCLDTLLFRSHHKLRCQLMARLLDNIHSLLVDNSGLYIVISPRSKIKFLRDYPGFLTVKHVPLQGNCDGVILGELDGRIDLPHLKTAHMYVCEKNSGYTPYSPGSCFQVPLEKNRTSEICPSCSLSFIDYKGKTNVDLAQQKMWERRWNGHLTHCKHKH